MKKILMTLVAAFVSVSMSAQFYVGGGVGFASFDDSNKSHSVFKFVPEVGYNLDEDMAVGIALTYTQGSTADAWLLTDPNKDLNEDLKTFSIAPYLRYSFAKFGPVTVFADGCFEYTHIDNDGAKANGWGLGIKPGIAVNLNEKFSFVSHIGRLGYLQSKDDVSGAKAVSTFGLDLDNALTFGLYYNF
jgi:hypothetical protein